MHSSAAKAKIDLSGLPMAVSSLVSGFCPTVQKSALINRYRTDIPVSLGTGDL